ncbi:MAG: hypothetical protein ACE5DX_02385 [Candidatus Dojkabacteria bacterium]
MKVFLTYSYSGQKRSDSNYKLLEESLKQIQGVTLITTKSKLYLTRAEERKIRKGLETLDIENTSPYESPQIGQIHDEAVKRTILRSDFIVVEVSEQSTKLGMEIWFAIAHKTPTLILSKTKNYADYIKSPYLFGARYTKYTLREHLEAFFERGKRELLSKRFNMYLSDAQFEDLEILAKKEDMNISEYIRDLVNEKRSKLKS